VTSSVSVAGVDLPVADERNVFLFVVYLLNILLNFHFMVSVHFKHYTSGFVLLVLATGALPAIKSEATAIFAPQDGRWKITVSFHGRRFCVPKFRH